MTSLKGRVLSEDHIYRDLTIGLGLLLLLSPILDTVTGTTKFDSYLTAAFLIFALYEITRKPSDLVVALALGIPAVVGGIFNAATPDTPQHNIVPVVLFALFMAFLVWRILRDIFSGRRISSEQIFGAVCAYLLIGFLFASIYGFIYLVDHNAFSVTDALSAGLQLDREKSGFSVFTYFSFVTMSTLGYGDIAPVSAAARSFAWIQAVLGQLYLAITIAALVGVHITSGRD
jgi:hypothetical protein